MIESQASIVDTIQGNLHAHILDHHPFARSHLLVPDPHNKAVDSLVLPVDDRLREHNRIVGMAGTVRDPELLGQSRW